MINPTVADFQSSPLDPVNELFNLQSARYASDYKADAQYSVIEVANAGADSVAFRGGDGLDNPFLALQEQDPDRLQLAPKLLLLPLNRFVLRP